MAERKLKVLCFCDFYLPGYRAGGPIRTIANMVLNLGDEIDFHIVTRDRDFGSNEPYRGVAIDAWNTVGKAKVFYASPASLSSGAMRRRIGPCKPPSLAEQLSIEPENEGKPRSSRGAYAADRRASLEG